MKYLIVLLMLCPYIMTDAQNLTVKSVGLRPQDARAASQPRIDHEGKKCAIIRVGVVGVDDLVFPDSVGNVAHVLNEYVVYVPDGLKSFRYMNKSGQKLGTIVFDEYDMEIHALSSYEVIFESESHLRSAIFSIQPKNALLMFNGENVNVDEDGLVIINMPVGDYSYKITAEGFEGQNGIVSLTEDDITTVKEIYLQEILYPVIINISPEDAMIFIDNVPYSKDARDNIKLSGGKHLFRVTATNYEDYESTIDVKSNLSPLNLNLKEKTKKMIKHKEERSRTRVSVRRACYFTLSGESYDKYKYNGFDYGGKIGIHYLYPFAGIFAFKWGIEGGIMHLNRDVKYELNENLNESTSSSGLWEIPLQLGVGCPFGKYNRHLFTVLFGGYARDTWVRTNEVIENDTKNNEKKYAHNDVSDFGFRLSAMLDLHHFVIGMEFSRSTEGHGQYLGCKIAYKAF